MNDKTWQIQQITNSPRPERLVCQQTGQDIKTNRTVRDAADQYCDPNQSGTLREDGAGMK